jgi:hypothetical protein
MASSCSWSATVPFGSSFCLRGKALPICMLSITLNFEHPSQYIYTLKETPHDGLILVELPDTKIEPKTRACWWSLISHVVDWFLLYLDYMDPLQRARRLIEVDKTFHLFSAKSNDNKYYSHPSCS